MTIKQLTDQIIDFRNNRDWSQYHKPKDMAAAVSIEAAELQEHFLWKNHEESAEHLEKHSEEVAEEMADIAIYLFLMASDAGVDISQAIQAKLAINEKRYPVDKAKGKSNKYTDYQIDDQ